MAKKGNGKKLDLTPVILQGIRDDMNKGFAALKAEGEKTNERISQLVLLLGDYYRKHEDRIKALEARLDRMGAQ